MRFARELLLTVPAVFIVSATALIPVAVARDVPYVPTPQPVVEEMLRLAKVSDKDMLYDLGSGDGRIVVTAAKKYGARGVGVDIDPERIAESRANARNAGVTDKVKFIEGDLFKVDLRPATAVTLYLLPAINLRLRPKLLEELRPGTPVVSHDFDMGDWKPEKKVTVQGSTVYLWHIPARVAGKWEYRLAAPDGREERHQLDLVQEIQTVGGTATIDGQPFAIEDGEVNGERLRFSVRRPVDGLTVVQRFEARATGNGITGVTARVDAAAQVAWLARRSAD